MTLRLVKSRTNDQPVVVKCPDNRAIRDAIFNLEDYLKEQPQVEIEYIHRFTPGMYAREMFVPAGIIITGAIHRTEHISIFLEGRLMVPGGEEIAGPVVEIGKPGIKRCGIVLEDIRWITMHPTLETDLEILEDQLWTNDPEEADRIIEAQLFLERDLSILADQEDYASLGISEEVISKLETLEVFKGDVENIEIRPSDRHGLGIFVNGTVSKDSIIAPGVKDGRLMEYSRYMNHSVTSNAGVIIDGNNANLVALRDIEDEEVTIDYRMTFPTDVESVIDEVLNGYERNLKCLDS